MDKQHRICVFMFLAIFALAYGETVDSKWRAQIEEKFEETLQTIQNNKNRIEKQDEVFKKQTNDIQKQAVEIKTLRQRVKALEGQSDNLEQQSGRLQNGSSKNGTVLSSMERQQLYNKALTESRDAKWRVHMEERMEEMLQMIQRQNEVIEKQKNTIEEQMKTIDKQELEINNLQDRVVKLERSDSQKQKSSSEIFTDMSTPNGTILSYEKDHMHNEDSKSKFTRRLLAPEVAHNSVAFYAYISNDFGGVGKHHVFVYDTEVTNQGNAYNKHTGVFTAPSTGLYAFCYTAFASGEHVAGETGNYGEVSVQLVHNGAYKGSIYVDTETNWEEEMATGFAILMLQAGDDVVTMSKDVGQGSYHSNAIGRWSFSGFQIS